MNIRERVLLIAESRGLKTSELERRLGLSRCYFRNTRSVSSEIVSRILYLFEDVSPDWLLTGRGEMLRETEQKTEIGSQTQMGIVNNITNSGHTVVHSPAMADTDTKKRKLMPNLMNGSHDAVLLDVISRQTDVIARLSEELANVRMLLEQQSAKMREMESALGSLSAHAQDAHSQSTSDSMTGLNVENEKKSVG